MDMILNKFRILLIVSSTALVACSNVPDQLGQCPQPRFTGKAPDNYYHRLNPLQTNADTVAAGKQLFQHDAANVSCAQCHGKNGNGIGPMSSMFDPPPRNFTCAQTINGVSDGQLFWIIQNGSPGTSMPPFAKLSDEQIWQIIMYIRQLANGDQGV